jgi:hypothetical protein
MKQIILEGAESHGFPQKETSEALEEISASITAAGLPEYLELSVGPAGGESEVLEHLRLLARRDVEMFFGPEPPLPGLASSFRLLLFPEQERPELEALLMSSTSRPDPCDGDREMDQEVSVVALLQSLVLLRQLFSFFLLQGRDGCSPEARLRAGERSRMLAERAATAARNPSPLLTLLRSRTDLDP